MLKQLLKKVIKPSFNKARKDEQQALLKQHKKTEWLFRTSYVVAKTQLSFCAYTNLVELQLLNGLDMVHSFILTMLVPTCFTILWLIKCDKSL